jgi:hypothetical protein
MLHTSQNVALSDNIVVEPVSDDLALVELLHGEEFSLVRSGFFLNQNHFAISTFADNRYKFEVFWF